MNTAAEELVNATLLAGAAGLPLAGKEIRKTVAVALGLSRLRADRYSDVVSEATSTGQIIKVGESLYPSEPRSSEPTKTPKPSPTSPTAVQASSVTKTSLATKRVGGTGKRTMGYLLQAKLRNESKSMSKGSSAAELFCNCPHCGKQLQVAARITT